MMDIEKLKQKYAEKEGKDNFTELLGSLAEDPTEMSEMYDGLLEFIKNYDYQQDKLIVDPETKLIDFLRMNGDLEQVEYKQVISLPYKFYINYKNQIELMPTSWNPNNFYLKTEIKNEKTN